MSDRVFVDTNILVYASDLGAGAKHERAKVAVAQLWEAQAGRVSCQVLSEYFVTVTRKLNPGMSVDEAWRDVVILTAWQPVEINWNLMLAARAIQQAHGLAWWDCMIVAAAQMSGCSVLFSEDLATGTVYGGVRVVNPLLADGVSRDR